MTYFVYSFNIFSKFLFNSLHNICIHAATGLFNFFSGRLRFYRAFNTHTFRIVVAATYSNPSKSRAIAE